MTKLAGLLMTVNFKEMQPAAWATALSDWPGEAAFPGVVRNVR